MSRSEADVLVAGGGPAGAVAALVLARSGRSVVLAESSTDSTFRVGESLPPSAKPLLRDLGLLDTVGEAGHLVSAGNVACWGSPIPRAHDFLRDPHGLGWHLDRTRFDADLRAAVVRAGARLLSGVRVAGAVREGDWRVSLRQAGTRSTLTCRWLVDATGRRALLARRLGGRPERSDRLVAFAARFRPSDSLDTDARTWIEAAPDGWWYAARLPSGELVTVLHTDADLVDRRALRTSEGFLARLAEAPVLAERLRRHGCELLGPPRAGDAGTARCPTPAGEGWLAVGDAALAFDPLSSQGIFNALYTGLRGAEAIDAASGSGGPAALVEYADRLAEVHRAYLAHRAGFYALERRWPDRPFWRRRTM